jgi:hypothetical protein
VKGICNNLLAVALQERLDDRKLLKGIAGSSEALRSELSHVNKELERGNANFESTLKQLLTLLFAKLENEYGLTIHYTPALTKAVMQFQGSFDDLELHLAKQVEIEANLAQLNEENSIWLDKIHLSEFKARRTSTKPDSLPLHLGRLSKAHALLDRYETAAEAAVNHGLSVIGKNIGSYCQPSISNAAITDALNKNAKKIVELFAKFPDKWPIIRSDFRSIANIIERESLRKPVS